MAYSPEQAAAWIITVFIRDLQAKDLDTLKTMIAADLRYAYQQGREDSLAAGTKNGS